MHVFLRIEFKIKNDIFSICILVDIYQSLHNVELWIRLRSSSRRGFGQSDLQGRTTIGLATES
jgi:hypothetical protein